MFLCVPRPRPAPLQTPSLLPAQLPLQPAWPPPLPVPAALAAAAGGRAGAESRGAAQADPRPPAARPQTGSWGPRAGALSTNIVKYYENFYISMKISIFLYILENV